MKRFVALALLGVLLGCCRIQAQEAFTLKLKETRVGDKVLISKTLKETNTVKIQDDKGATLFDKSEDGGIVMEFKETCLKREPKKRPTHVEREYVKAQQTKDGKTENLALQGKTIVIDKKGDKFTYHYKDGQEVPAAAAGELAKEFGRAEDQTLARLLLPNAAVKVGEGWKIDMEAVVNNVKGDEIGVDAAKATGTGSLLKVYKKDGLQFGAIQIKMMIPVKSIGKAQAKVDNGMIKFDGTFDFCIDGTSENGTLIMKTVISGSSAVEKLPGAKMVFDVIQVGTETHTELTRK